MNLWKICGSCWCSLCTVSMLISHALLQVSAGINSEHKDREERGAECFFDPGAEHPENGEKLPEATLSGQETQPCPLWRVSQSIWPRTVTRKGLTKQHKQGRGTSLPLSLPATHACFQLAFHHYSFHPDSSS